MIFFGEGSPRRAIEACLLHYHHHRNHQELSNQLIDAGKEVGQKAGEIHCDPPLGGMLNDDYRQAARRRRHQSALAVTHDDHEVKLFVVNC